MQDVTSKRNVPEERIRIFDPETGKRRKLEEMIRNLGVREVARKYRVSASTVDKWRRGVHRPALRTLVKTLKKFF